MRPGCCPWMGAGVGQELLLPPARVGCLGCGRAEPTPACPKAPLASQRWDCHGPARGSLQDLGWEVKSSSWAVLLEWCSSVSPAPKTGWARAKQRKNQELSASIHGKLSKARQQHQLLSGISRKTRQDLASQGIIYYGKIK